MKEKEICDYFIEYEYKNNLFDLTIGNVKIWIYLREIVYCDILKIKGCINDSFTQLKNKKNMIVLFHYLSEIKHISMYLIILLKR